MFSSTTLAHAVARARVIEFRAFCRLIENVISNDEKGIKSKTSGNIQTSLTYYCYYYFLFILLLFYVFWGGGGVGTSEVANAVLCGNFSWSMK